MDKRSRRPSSHQPVEELLVSAKLGDQEAIMELINRNRIAIVKGASLGWETDAADAISEAQIKIFTKFHTFSGDSPLRLAAWMKVVARNVAIDLARSQQRRSEQLVATDRLPELATYDSDRLSDVLLVKQVLDRLDPAARELLVLRFFLGLTTEEIGARLSYHPGHVRRQLSKALDAATTVLDRWDSDELGPLIED